MTQFIRKSAIALAVSSAVFCSGSAMADVKITGSITKQSTVKKFDKKIEAAAIAKAAEKIGSLRGSVVGDPIGEIISESDLTSGHSTPLGFPILNESKVRNSARPDGAVPMV